MIKKILSLTAIIVWILSVSNISFAQTAFYEGKTIRIIVGFSAAGGYDALARMLSRHMGKYIPGWPLIKYLANLQLNSMRRNSFTSVLSQGMKAPLL